MGEVRISQEIAVRPWPCCARSSRRRSLLSESLEALVDPPVSDEVEHFEVAVWCVRDVRRNWYLRSKGHAVPWRALDAALGSAAALDAVPGGMGQHLALAVLPSCNENFASTISSQNVCTGGEKFGEMGIG